MPKRRKVGVKEGGGATPERSPLDSEVKIERLSPERKATTQSSQDAELSQTSQSLGGRNLRPRKSTCYVEKYSPECEHGAQKVPRKRRRPNTVETVCEKERQQSVKEPSPAKKPVKRKRRFFKKKDDNVATTSRSTKVDDEETVKIEAKEGNEEDKDVKPAIEDVSKTETPTVVKRKVKRRVKKIPAANASEPVKPEDKGKGEAAGTTETSSSNLKTAADHDDTVPTVQVSSNVDENNKENEKPTLATVSPNTKLSTAPAPPLLPPKRRRRTKKIPIVNASEPGKPEVGGKAAGTTETNSSTLETRACDGTIPTVQVGPGVNESNKENEKPANLPPIPNIITAPPPPLLPPAVTRRPGFFRGRRSKALSSRTGKKEPIHIEEAINPEDIRGFEHVERYVTPAGVKLSKFWDSEDEQSDDDSTDNFRRIMCTFGANCRIHEVIRPASEIVRRLKELQNTFGASRTLPLFPKKEEDAMESGSISKQEDSEAEANVHKNIIWHNDPSFYEYINNFP